MSNLEASHLTSGINTTRFDNPLQAIILLIVRMVGLLVVEPPVEAEVVGGRHQGKLLSYGLPTVRGAHHHRVAEPLVVEQEGDD